MLNVLEKHSRIYGRGRINVSVICAFLWLLNLESFARVEAFPIRSSGFDPGGGGRTILHRVTGDFEFRACREIAWSDSGSLECAWPFRFESPCRYRAVFVFYIHQ